MTKPVWIGLVEVRPRPANDDLGDALGAYVPALAPALTEDEFVAVTTAGWTTPGTTLSG